jgi:hypothetical protein
MTREKISSYRGSWGVKNLSSSSEMEKYQTIKLNLLLPEWNAVNNVDGVKINWINSQSEKDFLSSARNGLGEVRIEQASKGIKKPCRERNFHFYWTKASYVNWPFITKLCWGNYEFFIISFRFYLL